MDPIPSGSNSNELLISRMVLFNKMRESGYKKLEDQFDFLKKFLKDRTKCSTNGLGELYSKISHFTSRFKEKWIAADRVRTRFITKNKDWLETSVSFKMHDVNAKATRPRGRPTLTFDESSDRTKRAKVQKIRNSTSLEKLVLATQMKLRSSGYPVASKLLQDIVSSPKRASKYRDAYKATRKPCTKKMSAEEALSVMVEAKLTTHQYNIIRQKDPERFPSFKVVQMAKKMCYPKKESVTVTPTSAEVTLQALLDHTTERIITVQRNVMITLKPEQMSNLCLVLKWGFDGSSGHSSYKQRFIGTDADDSSVFISSIVPLRLVVGDPGRKDAVVVWQNPRTSSTRFCRPIKLQFVKESPDISLAEKTRTEKEIKDLRSTSGTFEGKYFTVSHKLCFTMVDGKVCNSLTNTTSTQRCYICGASSKEFNCINKMLTRQYDASKLEFGLSVLHCWIRSFECLLHLGYKLPIKKWQARNNDKEIVTKRKVQIQKDFREKVGLIVDRPKPGFGNSNDGNTARRFFENATLSSEITGVSKDLICKMHIILVTISSGFEIHIENFRDFTISTAKLFVQLYPWFFMPPTIHKLLIHGPDVIAAALLPIGQLTEEAQEARNKDFKKYREGYSRKCSREDCNQDVFNMMLITSDPVISSYRQLPVKKLKHFPKEVFDLIISPDVPMADISNIESGEDSSSSESISDY